MFNRFCFGALLLAGLAVPLTGCNNTSGLDSIQVSRTSASMVVGGSTLQLTVTGTFGNQSHPSYGPVTGVTWTTDATGVASVDSSGVVTAEGAGTAVITATAQAYNGPVTSTATITVTGGSGGAGGDVVSISITPVAQTVASPPDTSQFIAIGTTSSGATLNVTSTAVWTSSSVQVATVCSTGTGGLCPTTPGLATAVGKGNTTITAVYTNTDHNAAMGSATFTVTNGAAEAITALSIVPASLTLSATGQPGQFIALGTSGTTGLQEDVTNLPQLAWSSSIPAYATITSGLTAGGNGVAQGVSPGTTPILAEWTNSCSPSPCTANVVSAQASVTVTSTPAAEPLLSIAIVPTSLTTLNLEGTGQFLAYGTFSTAPTLMDITNGFYHAGFPTAGCTAALAAAGSSPCTLIPANWISPMPGVFTVNSSGAPGSDAGLVTAEGSGNGVIYVTAANPDSTLVYSPTATFNCPYAAPSYSGVPNTLDNMTSPGTCNEYTIAPPLLVTLTVYNAGLNTTNWLVTAPSATNTPDVIHCGPGSASGGSVCMATYPVGTTIILTAPAQAGVAFGGWSWNCEDTAPVTADGPNSCTVYLGAIDSVTDNPVSNVSVGAVFNNR